MGSVKKTASLLLVLGLSLGLLTACGAADSQAASLQENGYLETHFQIDYDRLNLAVSGGEIMVTAQEGADDDASLLGLLLGEFPGLEQLLIEALATGEPLATGFTLLPLAEANGHFERVPAATRGYEPNSLYAGESRFLLCTTVVAGAQNDGSRTYTAISCGVWSAGATSASRGEDFALLTVPESMSLSADAFAARYDSSPAVGIHGADYRRQNGGSQFIEYAVAEGSGGYYIHTWREVTAGFSLFAGPHNTLMDGMTASQPDSGWVAYAPVSVVI